MNTASGSVIGPNSVDEGQHGNKNDDQKETVRQSENKYTETTDYLYDKEDGMDPLSFIIIIYSFHASGLTYFVLAQVN